MKKRTFLTAIITAAALMITTAFAAPTPPQPFTPEQTKNIQKIVRQYLIQNPQILVEVSQALQAKQNAQMEKTAMSAIQQNKQQIFNDPKSPTMGNPNGNTLMVEFFDYQCGHCKTMGKVISALIKKNPNLKVIFKELPIFGGNSQFAAKAALAAADQSKYYAFHNALLNAKNPLSPKKVVALAKKVGINVKQMQQHMKSDAVMKQIRENFQLAKALRIMGTPAFIISNKQLSQFKFIPGAAPENALQAQLNAIK